jgi:chromosome segregation ATPase
VADEASDEGLRDRLSRQGEEALGRLAEELVGNPVVNAALSRAFDAREKAVQAQEAAMGALGIPSAADVERVTRRLRSVSQRLEGIEDSVDRLDDRLEGIERRLREAGGDEVGDALDRRARAIERRTRAIEGRAESIAGRAEAMEARLDEIARDLSALRRELVPGGEPPPRTQERLRVGEP